MIQNDEKIHQTLTLILWSLEFLSNFWRTTTLGENVGNMILRKKLVSQVEIILHV